MHIAAGIMQIVTGFAQISYVAVVTNVNLQICTAVFAAMSLKSDRLRHLVSIKHSSLESV